MTGKALENQHLCPVPRAEFRPVRRTREGAILLPLLLDVYYTLRYIYNSTPSMPLPQGTHTLGGFLVFSPSQSPSEGARA